MSKQFYESCKYHVSRELERFDIYFQTIKNYNLESFQTTTFHEHPEKVERKNFLRPKEAISGYKDFGSRLIPTDNHSVHYARSGYEPNKLKNDKVNIKQHCKTSQARKKESGISHQRIGQQMKGKNLLIQGNEQFTTKRLQLIAKLLRNNQKIIPECWKRNWRPCVWNVIFQSKKNLI